MIRLSPSRVANRLSLANNSSVCPSWHLCSPSFPYYCISPFSQLNSNPGLCMCLFCAICHSNRWHSRSFFPFYFLLLFLVQNKRHTQCVAPALAQQCRIQITKLNDEKLHTIYVSLLLWPYFLNYLVPRPTWLQKVFFFFFF